MYYKKLDCIPLLPSIPLLKVSSYKILNRVGLASIISTDLVVQRYESGEERDRHTEKQDQKLSYLTRQI